MIGYTQGRFDVIHYGHIISLQNMKKYLNGGMLIVGVATDEFSEMWKKEKPVLNWEARSTILRHIDFVDIVIPYDEVYPDKLQDKIKFDLFFCSDELYDTEIGNNLRKFNFKTIFLPRTPNISSTMIKGAKN